MDVKMENGLLIQPSRRAPMLVTKSNQFFFFLMRKKSFANNPLLETNLWYKKIRTVIASGGGDGRMTGKGHKGNFRG